MVIPMPMHPIFNPQLSEDGRAEYLDDFRQKFQTVAVSEFLKAQRDNWFFHVVTPWLLTLIPPGWSELEFAEWLGINRSQIGRYRRGESAPSDAVVYQWLRSRHKSFSEMPRISQQLIYPAFGIAATAQHLEWKTETDRLPVFRRQRKPAKNPIPVADVALTFSLISDQLILERWIGLGWAFQSDITQALTKNALPQLLPDIIDNAIRILDAEVGASPVFVAARDELARLDLSGIGTEAFLTRVQSLWVPYQFHWFCTHDCTSDLFFDIID